MSILSEVEGAFLDEGMASMAGDPSTLGGDAA